MLLPKERTSFKIHTEASEYEGCEYILDEKKFIHRKAKITPKKIGQFVTLWKRDNRGATCPYHEDDLIDFVVIICEKGDSIGHFLFPKNILVERKIISSKNEGKRGFRVYPTWDKPENKQAIQTQKWQITYFKTTPFRA